MRTLSGTLVTELGLTRTRPGYLVELGFASTLRLSTLGALSYNGYSWYPADIKVAGLSRNEQGQQAGTLSIGNTDLDYGALILSEGVADKTIRIWSVWAGAPSEAMPEFDGIGDDAEIDGLRVTIKLSSGARRYAYSPRRIIGPQTGVNVRLPAGTRITVGGMTVTLEAKSR